MLKRYKLFYKIIAVITTFVFVPSVFAGNVAIIKTRNLAPYNEAITGFTINCSSIKTREYDMEEDQSRGEEIASQINASKPSAVLAVGNPAAQIAKLYIDKSIPVVFIMVQDPEKIGLRGIDNITGISMNIPVETQLRALKALVPSVTKVGAIYNPKISFNDIKDAMKISNQLGFRLIAVKVDNPGDVSRALRAFAEGIDAYWMLPDRTVMQAFTTILAYTNERKIPFLAPLKIMVDQGALVSLAANYANIGSQGCGIVGQVIGGTKPSQIPISSPKGLELTVNLTAAKTLGLQSIATNAMTFGASEGYKISVSQ
ncbi:MAG: ABC transporter substrate-binding protein [Deltaproteobacteria bacterium]|nr:ABC transporter substrate-binding protein [Deltaproteobacteria bacterium]MCL5277906.1 ABC transporter substrate-binding protein [Deltaproteobacteria bacterium]